MQYHEDYYVSVSFSLPKSVKAELDRRALRLRLTRTDYLKLLVLADLDRGIDAPLLIERKPRLELAPPPELPAKRHRVKHSEPSSG